MTSRRKFLQHISVAAAGTVTLPYCKQSGKKNQGIHSNKKEIGLQLYSVREQMSENPMMTLNAISEIGYTQIETAEYSEGKFYQKSPAEFKKMTDDLGLQIVSSHIPIEELYKNAEHTIETVVNTDQSYLVLPWLDQEQRNSIEKYQAHIALMNRVGELCQSADITFCYHNHDFEFWPLEGQTPIDLILKETDADKVKIELDIYWISKVGKDPIKFIRDNPGRCPLWHLKDMDTSKEKNITEVGNGIIDFKSILAEAETAQLTDFFIEQDHSINTMESIKKSYDYVNQI